MAELHYQKNRMHCFSGHSYCEKDDVLFLRVPDHHQNRLSHQASMQESKHSWKNDSVGGRALRI